MLHNKIKVALLHNIMAPYRYPLFAAIASYPELDFEVWFMSKTARNRRWKIDVEKLSFPYRIFRSLQVNVPGKDLFTYIVNYTFAWTFFTQRPQVIISAGWLDMASQLSFLFCKVTGRKYILWSESTANEKSWRRSITFPFVKMIVQGADACVSVGSRSNEYLLKLGANPKTLFTAYSTVDIEAFSRQSQLTSEEKTSLKKKYGLKTKYTILFSGQFIKRKGILLLIKAFQNLKPNFDVSLILVGYGPQQVELEKYVFEANLKNIRFIPHQEPEQLAQLYGLSDIFVLPSEEETWGLVVNEAMAAGLPVIVSKAVGASIDLVREGYNGYTFASGSVEELNAKLSTLLSQTELLKKMSSNAKEHIQHFSPEAAAEQFRAAIHQVVRYEST